MFFKIQDPSASITYVKIAKISEEAVAENKASLAQGDSVDTDRSLSIKGFTENGEILFQYIHKSQGIEQSFGVNLKKYNAFGFHERDPNRKFIGINDTTEEETLNE